MKTLYSLLFVLLSSIVSNTATAGSIAIIKDNLLVGVKGMYIESYGYYDLEFTNNFNQVYKSNSFARAASDAIYLFFKLNDFESPTSFYHKHNNVYGCTLIYTCTMVTPTFFSWYDGNQLVQGWAFNYTSAGGAFRYQVNGGGGLVNTKGEPLYPAAYTFANWSPSSIPSPVPIPASFLLLAPFLLLLVKRSITEKTTELV